MVTVFPNCSETTCEKVAAVKCINGKWMCKSCCDKLVKEFQHIHELPPITIPQQIG